MNLGESTEYLWWIWRNANKFRQIPTNFDEISMKYRDVSRILSASRKNRRESFFKKCQFWENIERIAARWRHCDPLSKEKGKTKVGRGWASRHVTAWRHVKAPPREPATASRRQGKKNAPAVAQLRCLEHRWSSLIILSGTIGSATLSPIHWCQISRRNSNHSRRKSLNSAQVLRRLLEINGATEGTLALARSSR